METPLNEVPTPPELPQTENPTSQSPAKKRKKWLLPVIIGGGAAFLLVIAGIIAFFLLRSSNLPFKPDTSLIPVMNGDHWGYINKKGKILLYLFISLFALDSDKHQLCLVIPTAFSLFNGN